MINVLLSRVEELFGNEEGLATAVKAHRRALAAHVAGEPNLARPAADPIVEALIERVPASGPVDERGPDSFVIQRWRIVDDRPKTPEQEQALNVLRETIN